MPSDNPLEPIFDAYEVSLDCFKVARRSIDARDDRLIAKTQFFGATPDEAETALTDGRTQLVDSAVLSLWSAFERFVIEQVQGRRTSFDSDYPPGFARLLATKFEYEVERWRFAEILDLFKSEIGVDLLGQVKQIKQYRDWVAHRNPKSRTPTKTDPETTFDVLSRVIHEIREKHAPPS